MEGSTPSRRSGRRERRGSVPPAPPKAGVRGRFDAVMRTLWRRGATEVTLLVLAGAVASGVVFGAGVARASSATSNGQIWVNRPGTGTVVEVNPVTGSPVTEVNLGLTAGEKHVQQGGGVLLVTDPATGRSTSFDIGSMLVTGSRVDDASTSRTVYQDGQAYVVDLANGVVRAVDPLTLTDQGQAYSAGGALADAAVDQSGTLWALRPDGILQSVRWSGQARRFIDEGTTRVNGAGDGARLAPHPQGVTVFSPGTGAVVQVGTGSDAAAVVPQITGQVLPAPMSPTDLTAATVPGSSVAVIMSGSRVYASDLASIGCQQPGAPAVFAGKVYVPCSDNGRTVVLGPNGQQAGPDISAGDNSTPLLTQDQDALVITNADGSNAVTVDAQGQPHPFDLAGGGIAVVVASTSTAASSSVSVNAGPTQTSTSVPTSTPPTGPPPGSTPSSSAFVPTNESSPAPPAVPPSNGVPPGTTGAVQPAGGTSPTTASQAGPPSRCTGPGRGCAPDNAAPQNVTAVPGAVGTVVVTWQPGTVQPRALTVLTTDGGYSTSVDPTQTSATIVGLRPGDVLRFVVIANVGGASVASVASAPVTVPAAADAGAPTSGGTTPATATSTSGAGPTSTAGTPVAPPVDTPVTTSSAVAPPGSDTTVPPPSTTAPAPTTSPAVSTTTSEPSTSEPPAPTTSEPPPPTTSEPPPPTSAPRPPTPPTSTPAQTWAPPTSLTANPMPMSVRFNWTAPVGVTPSKYLVTWTRDDGTAGSSTTTTTGTRIAAPSQGCVTATVMAVYDGGSSAGVTASGCSIGAEPSYCSPPRNGVGPTRCVPAAYTGGAVITPGVYHPVTTSDHSVRYATAAGLLLLAGLVRFGRYRFDAEREERTDDSPGRRTRRSRRGDHR